MSVLNDERRVLLVEDSQQDREILAMATTRAGLTIDWHYAASCAELRGLLAEIERGERVPPEVVIMDLRISGGYSSDVLPELRAKLPAGLPVIVFSTSSAAKDRDRIAADPHASYLVKPHSFAGYQEIVERIQDLRGG